MLLWRGVENYGQGLREIVPNFNSCSGLLSSSSKIGVKENCSPAKSETAKASEWLLKTPDFCVKWSISALRVRSRRGAKRYYLPINLPNFGTFNICMLASSIPSYKVNMPRCSLYKHLSSRIFLLSTPKNRLHSLTIQLCISSPHLF